MTSLRLFSWLFCYSEFGLFGRRDSIDRSIGVNVIALMYVSVAVCIVYMCKCILRRGLYCCIDWRRFKEVINQSVRYVMVVLDTGGCWGVSFGPTRNGIHEMMTEVDTSS